MKKYKNIKSKKGLDECIRRFYQNSISENVKMAKRKLKNSTCNVNKSKVYCKQIISIYYE